MSTQQHTLRVSNTRGEIGGIAKSIEFDVPEHLGEQFTWKSGQHITLCFDIQGKEVRRSYTISSSSDAGDPLRVTVKRVKGGVVSNYINDHINEGSELSVMPPKGKFTLTPESNEHRTHYFFGAGSGITPLFAMIRSVLYHEPHSDVHLIYGNHNHKTIIFREELEQLQSEFNNRFSVSHVLSKPAMLTSFTPWRTGVIDQDAIKALIDEYPPYAQNTQYYICGPGTMNESVAEALRGFDVPTDRIHLESFGGKKVSKSTVEGVEATCKIKLDGSVHEVHVNKNQTLLDAIKDAGHTTPYSCETGVCGTCKARLTTGTVEMRSRASLDDDEIKNGDILPCQSTPTSRLVHIEYPQ